MTDWSFSQRSLENYLKLARIGCVASCGAGTHWGFIMRWVCSAFALAQCCPGLAFEGALPRRGWGVVRLELPHGEILFLVSMPHEVTLGLGNDLLVFISTWLLFINTVT